MNYIFQLTQMTWSLDAMPNTPLYALTIPYDVLRVLWRARKHVLQCFRGDQGRGDESAAAAKRRVMLKPPGKHTRDVQKLRDDFERYIGENQDEIAQEERWRTTMKKDVKQRLDTHERRQMEQLKKLEAQLEQHARQQRELLGTIMKALPASPNPTAPTGTALRARTAKDLSPSSPSIRSKVVVTAVQF